MWISRAACCWMGHHRDAGVEIQEPVAVYILHHRAFTALHHQRVAARVRRGNMAGVAFDDGPRTRAGNGADHVGKIRADLFQGLGHGKLLFGC